MCATTAAVTLRACCAVGLFENEQISEQNRERYESKMIPRALLPFIQGISMDVLAFDL